MIDTWRPRGVVTRGFVKDPYSAVVMKKEEGEGNRRERYQLPGTGKCEFRKMEVRTVPKMLPNYEVYFGFLALS